LKHCHTNFPFLIDWYCIGNKQTVQRNVSGEESSITGISTISQIMSYEYKIDIININKTKTHNGCEGKID
jgi:hypothetical protein